MPLLGNIGTVCYSNALFNLLYDNKTIYYLFTSSNNLLNNKDRNHYDIECSSDKDVNSILYSLITYFFNLRFSFLLS